MPVIAMTDRWLQALRGTGERVDFADARTPGLALRVSGDGDTKTWSFSYRRASDGRRSRLTLGRYPALSLAAARAEALAHAVAVARGADPAGDRRRAPAVATLRDLCEAYLARRGPEIRSAALVRVRLEASVLPKFGDTPPEELRRADVALHFERLARTKTATAKTRRGGPAGANRTRDDLLAVLNWGVASGLIEANPLAGLKRPAASVSRDRVLSPEEIRTLLARLPASRMDDASMRALRLLLLTGARAGEILGTMLAEVDLKGATVAVSAVRSKNGRAFVVPLSGPALAVVTEQIAAEEEAERRRAKRERREARPVTLLFPNARTGAPLEPHALSVAVRRNLALLGLEKFTPHDLRRTAATLMADCGVQPHIIEVCLNHVSGFRSGVAGVYNRNPYFAEHCDALDRLAARIADIEADRGVIVAFARRGAA